MEGKGNGNTVLLTVIGVATLLVALVGATFAYFTATVSNDAAQSVSVTTVTPVGLTYTGTALTLANTQPGNEKSETFTVVNPNPEDGAASSAMTYDLTMKVDNNSFVATDGANQLVITITGSGTTNQPSVAQESYDMTDSTSTAAAGQTFAVVSDQRIAIGETQTYSIKVEFKELGKDQSTNTGKAFGAHIEISDVKAVN